MVTSPAGRRTSLIDKPACRGGNGFLHTLLSHKKYLTNLVRYFLLLHAQSLTTNDPNENKDDCDDKKDVNETPDNRESN